MKYARAVLPLGSARRSWFCTAGFVNEGESSAQAAKRLAREELGMTRRGELPYSTGRK